MSLETKWCTILFQGEANPIKKEILQLVISPQLAINKPCNISKKNTLFSALLYLFRTHCHFNSLLILYNQLSKTLHILGC